MTPKSGYLLNLMIGGGVTGSAEPNRPAMKMHPWSSRALTAGIPSFDRNSVEMKADNQTSQGTDYNLRPSPLTLD